MEKLDSALCQWIVLYTNYLNFQFSYLHTFYKQKNIKTKPSIKLKPIFKFSTIMRQINIPLWTHMGHKGWRKDGKRLIRCYTIVLKLWDDLMPILFYYISQVIVQ